jgi:imidazolonepropionase-like amidohydrolase
VTRLFIGLVLLSALLQAQVAVRGERVFTMAGSVINDGVVLLRDAKIEKVGLAAQVPIPSGYKLLRAKVVTPGLIDAHTVVGFSGYLNQPHDQDQVERSAPAQPELRAIDAYDARERLVEYLRTFGITTIHTGHGVGTLISGQTMIAKTIGQTAEEAVFVPESMIAATFGDGARTGAGKSPGTRSKMAAMLRTELIKAQEYVQKPSGARDLRLEAFVSVVKREKPLLVTVHKAADILTVIRLGREFNLRLVLDGASDAHLILDEIKASGYPVILHPTMARAGGETENLSLETAARLKEKGIPFALQSGYESYVPKTRVVLWEAGVAAANGLGLDNALASITIDAAKILGVEKRVGSLEAGKDGDVAMFDGDPFEYTTHCIGVIIDGKLVSEKAR